MNSSVGDLCFKIFVTIISAMITSNTMKLICFLFRLKFSKLLSIININIIHMEWILFLFFLFISFFKCLINFILKPKRYVFYFCLYFFIFITRYDNFYLFFSCKYYMINAFKASFFFCNWYIIEVMKNLFKTYFLRCECSNTNSFSEITLLFLESSFWHLNIQFFGLTKINSVINFHSFFHI